MQQLGLSVTSISHCCQASLSGEVPFSAKAPAGATLAMIFAQALHSSGVYAAASDVFHILPSPIFQYGDCAFQAVFVFVCREVFAFHTNLPHILNVGPNLT